MNNSHTPSPSGTQNSNAAALQSEKPGDARALQPVAPAWHTLLLLIVMAGYGYLSFTRAAHARAIHAVYTYRNYFPTMIIEWILFAYVVFGARRKGIGIKELLGPRWSRGKAIFTDIGIAAIFWIVSLFALGTIAQLLHIPSALSNVKFMMPQTPLDMVVWVLLSFTAGICEEAIFRAYLQRQFAAWTRSLPIGVVLSAAVFGAAHSYQGGRQPILLGFYGLMFGILAAVRKTTKPGMMAHAFQDSASGVLFNILAKHNLIHP
ncbi:MAG TPA: type II CAAX endopeptidase family protein [Candidatus Acidoferrum sp.]|nr:type II CAAX endopeptidase family protein [Candidatus Acidoferrum sp.]